MTNQLRFPTEPRQDPLWSQENQNRPGQVTTVRDGQKIAEFTEITDKPLAFTEMANQLRFPTEPRQDPLWSQGNQNRT